MSLASIPRGAFRVRVVHQDGCRRGFGPWCVTLWAVGLWTQHVARHTTRASAEKHAKRLRAALRGEP